MSDLERVVIENTGDSGYFKDIVARQDLIEVKKTLEEFRAMKEITQAEAKNIYNSLYQEIFG